MLDEQRRTSTEGLKELNEKFSEEIMGQVRPMQTGTLSTTCTQTLHTYPAGASRFYTDLVCAAPG